MSDECEVIVGGVTYVPKVDNVDGMKYCIVRSTEAGVFAGYVKERNGNEAVLLNSRRLWRWCGAASLSELSQKGVSKPDQCKFPCEVPEETVIGVIEVIPCSKKAIESIKGVSEWTAH